MKTAKRTLAVLLACLMVFGSFSVVGSAKFNSSSTIDPVNPGESGNGKITYGLDIYKVGDEGLTKLADGDTLSPGDVIEVQVAFGTDFYMGALTGQIYYDSDYLQPALNGAAYTVTDSGNIWEEDNQLNPPFMKQLTEDLPKATTKDGLYTVDLFGALTPIELGGLKGIVNKDDQDAVVRRYTPLAWRIAEKNGQPQTKITAACDVDPEMLHYHFVQFQLASNNQNLIDKHNIIVPYATYASFQLLVKEGADSAGELKHAIFIPIDAAKRETAQTCNQLYGTNTNRNNGIFSAQASVAYLNGQGIDVTNADYDFKFGEAEPPHEHTYGEPTWTWNDEYTEATATFTCTDNDDTQTVTTTNINTTVISELGCVTDYVVTYSATVSFGDQDYTDTTDPFTVDYATGHTWSDSIEKIDEQYHGHKCTVCEAVDEETKEEHVYNIEGGIIRDATLNAPGLKLMECICGAQTEVEFTLDHDHTYGEPVWSWNDDYTEATATFTCVDNDDTQTVTTTDISCEELEEAKCGVDQVVQYLASVEFGDETYETTSDPVTVPGTALEHTYGDPEWNWADDYSSATATFKCKECSDEQVVNADIITNTISDLGCTTDNVVTYTATAEFGDEEYSDTTDEVTLATATGHTYGDPTWAWADDYSSATATFVCENCDDEQVVDADSIDMTVVQDLTCTDDKIVTYTATIDDFEGNSYNDTTDEIVAETATGTHSYGDPEWDWADDYSSATATFVCSVCDDEQVVNADIETNTVSELGCESDHVVTYTATANFENEDYTDTTDEITLETATDHSFGAWAPNGEYTHIRYCLNDGCNEFETEDHNFVLDPDKSTPATITSGGTNVYVCSVCRYEKREDTDPLDHTHEYGDPTWTWADDYSSATATFTCGQCSEELTLTDNAPVMNEVTPAGCTNDQVVTYTATVNLNETDYSDTTDEVTVPDTATGHNWGDTPTNVVWADDYTSVTATFTCQNCGDTMDVTETVDPATDFNIVEEAGCGKDAIVEYTKTLDLGDGTTVQVTSQPVTQEGSALSDHVYGEPEWEWADDLSSATAIFTCTSCGHEVRVVADIDAVVSELGCDTDDSITYTAVAELNGEEYTDSKVVVNQTATGHAYGEPEWVWADDYSSATAIFMCENCDDEQVVNADIETNTVSELGCESDHVVIYTATVYFGDEEVEYSDTTDEITIEEADGHVYSEPSWEWADDYTSATATFVCENCDDVQTVVTENIDCEELEEAECEKDQVVQYLASVEFGDEVYETTSDPVTIPDTATGHVWGDPVWEWADDYSSATATFTCENNETHQVVLTDDAPVMNEVTPATCEDDQVVTYTATVMFRDEEYTNTTDEVVVPDTATGHSYGDPDWEWADDYSSATATFTCQNDGCNHTETVTDDAPVMNEVTPATCEDDQVVTYTATVEFEDETYTDTTDEIVVPDTAIGHSYGDPDWEWADDYSSATATFTCQNDGCNHTETVTDDAPVKNVVTPATCEDDQIVTYTATVNFEGNDYTDTTDEVVDPDTATGHNYGDPDWEWADDYSSATATFTCQNDGCNHTETVTDNAPVMNEVTPATCEDDQVVTYTATVNFEGTDYSDTTDEVTVPDTATGHNFGEPVWTWADDYSSATATFTCQNNGCTEEEVLPADIDATVVQNQTCTNDELTTYTATVMFRDVEYTDTTDPVKTKDATDHNFGAWEDFDEENHIRYCQNAGCDASETEAHAFTEWTVVTEPTETTEGKETRTCTICGREESRPIDKLPPLLLYVDDSTEGANVVRVTVPYGRRGTTAFNLSASEEDVTYTIDQQGSRILSVDENGKVTYKRLCLFCDSAVITATTPDGRTATCEVNVKMKWWQIIIWFMFGSLWY